MRHHSVNPCCVWTATLWRQLCTAQVAMNSNKHSFYELVVWNKSGRGQCLGTHVHMFGRLVFVVTTAPTTFPD